MTKRLGKKCAAFLKISQISSIYTVTTVDAKPALQHDNRLTVPGRSHHDKAAGVRAAIDREDETGQLP